MCKVYNSVGCLTQIQSRLREQKVGGNESVEELIHFQQNYGNEREKIIGHYAFLLEQEKEKLSEEIVQLTMAINATKGEVEEKLTLQLEQLKLRLENLPSTLSTVMQVYEYYFKKSVLSTKIWFSELLFNYRLNYSIRHLNPQLTEKNNRFHYLNSNFEEALNNSSLISLTTVDQKKNIIDELSNSIYGAIGEQKVVAEIEKLSNDYILINDFNCIFNPPLFHPEQKQKINSIQIDHLLIGPPGIFLIETKNWSLKSIENMNLRSPIQQIKRSGYALYKLLNGKMATSTFNLKKHHWGDQKVPTRNVLVLLNHKPKENFKFVKVVNLSELLSYVNYFESCLSNNETTSIANYLNWLNGKNV